MVARPIRASFDVFDTVLTRAVGDHGALPLLLGRRLRRRGIIAVTPEVFAELRRHAEQRAKREGQGDPRLDRIATELARSLGGQVGPEVLEEEETALERLLSRTAPAGVALVERIRPANVAFLSDTTLPTREVVALLSAAGVWREGDVCLCSSETGTSKAAGTMFVQAATELEARPAELTHHGDHPRSDVRNARLSGWNVRYVGDAAPNRFEAILNRHQSASGGLSSVFAGASRIARTRHRAGDPRQDALASVAAGVMAPTLTAWVLWTIRRARETGCTRIYYMSRDGQVLVDIARGLEQKLQTGIDHRYLYGGRHASTSLRSLDASFSLHDLRDEEIAELLPEHLRDREKWDRLMYGDQDELRGLLQTPRAQELLAAGTERARQLLIDYLRQEGWDEEGRYALVDVGWRGRIPAALASTLADSELSMPDLLLYFGLEKGALDRMPPELASHLQAYHFDRSRDEGYVAALPGLQVMVEMFCVADHAPVTGYTRTPDGRVGPVIDGAFTEAVDWGLPHVRRVVDEFVSALVLDDDLVDPWTDLRPAVDELLREFWTSPTPDEVDAWGAFPVASDEVHSDHYPIAKPVSAAWIRQAVKTRIRQNRAGGREPGVGHIWYWPAGVVANSPLQYRAAYQAITRVRRQVPRTARRAEWARQRIGAAVGR